jgi:hypothetical protein
MSPATYNGPETDGITVVVVVGAVVVVVGAVVVVVGGGAGGGELEVEGDVGAGPAVLVDLHGEGVEAFDQQRRGDVEGRVGGFGDAPGGGVALVGERSCGEVGSGDLGAVEVDGGTVVASQAEGGSGDGVGVGELEGVSEVGRLVLAGGVGAVADHGALVAVAVAELGGASVPGVVVERRCAPRDALVGAVVEVPPHRPLRHHHLGRGASAARPREQRGEQAHEDDQRDPSSASCRPTIAMCGSTSHARPLRSQAPCAG